MASCNLNYSGHTGVINAEAYVYEITTSGTTRTVQVVLDVYAIDYSGARDGGYSVYCRESGTNISVPVYNGFTITGSAQTIFDRTFEVTVPQGSTTASIDLTFSASLVSPSSGTRSISGSITQLYLTQGSDSPDVGKSDITLSTDRVQMGRNVLISIRADSPECYHRLYWRTAGTSIALWEGNGTSYAWTVPDRVDLCPNALEVRGYIYCETILWGAYLGEVTEELTLTVPDATTPSAVGGEMTLGQAAEVLCPRNSRYFSQKLELEFYGTTTRIAEGMIDSAVWTPGYEPAALIPSLTYGTGTLKCTTMNGTAVVGTGTATVRLRVPENDVTRPKFTAEGLKLSPVSDLGEAFQGLYIRGKTGVRAEMEAVSDYSEIVRYQLTVGTVGTEGNPAVLDTLVSEGNVKVVAKAIDARGFTGTVTAYISVLPYRKPRIIPYRGYSAVICERAMENGELNAKGTYLAIKAGMEYSSILAGGQNLNECSLGYRWKISNSGSFTAWEDLLPYGSEEREISQLISNVVSSLETSYVVEIRAVDALGENHTMAFQIMTEAVSFVLYDGEDGAGFGKYPEAPHVVDIASHMTLLVRGRLVVEGADWQDLGLAEGVSEDIIGIGRKPVSGCHYRVENGNHVYLAFDGSFNFPTSPLVINRTPIPEEYRPRRPVMAVCLTDVGFAVCTGDTDGYIRVEAVYPYKENTATVSGMDGYIDYWI